MFFYLSVFLLIIVIVNSFFLLFCVLENVDHWLENYIIANKNSLERAKESLDMYFSVRVLVPEVFTQRDPLHAEIRKSAQVM